MACHCGGDIDDCLLNIEEDVLSCMHCDFDDEDEDWFDEDDCDD